MITIFNSLIYYEVKTDTSGFFKNEDLKVTVISSLLILNSVFSFFYVIIIVLRYIIKLELGVANKKYKKLVITHMNLKLTILLFL